METLTIYTDGGARGNPGPAGIGNQVLDASNNVLLETSEYIGETTNNVAEYQAVVAALEALKKRFGKATKDMQFELKLDSELVKKQLSGEYQIKDADLGVRYLQIHNLRVSQFPHLTFTHIKRELNKEADRLVNEALDAQGF